MSEEKKVIDYLKFVCEYIDKEHQKLNGELKDEIKRQGNTRETEEKYIEENFISKDKIRNKIEELENEREQLRIDKKVTWDSQIYKIDLKISAYRELLEEK